MRRCGVLLAIVCCLRPASADPPPPVPTQQTNLLGAAPPSFAGHWLLVATVALSDKSQSLTVLWNVVDEGGRPRVTLELVRLPQTVQAHLDVANAAGTAWSPSAEDLQALATEWDRLAPLPDQQIDAIATDVATPSGYDDGLKTEPEVKDAAWLVRQTKQFRRDATPAIQETQVFAVESTGADGFGGAFRSVTLAKAMIVIPISLGGRFQAFPIRGPSAGGWLTRLADLFVGCGRH